MRPGARPIRGRAGPLWHASLASLVLACGTASADTPAASSRSAPAPSGGKAAKPPVTARAALRWPLQVQGAILSSFGEYRYDHLHAGIDISTGGGTGYKVLAAAAGEVFRLKVEWRGYGRALYLRHPGGRVTVYGHLKKYEDKVLGLERLVARQQATAGTRYPGDIYLDRPIPVARGQVIAFSGESGVGLPHLHFEVRDGNDAPVDPFGAGLPHPADRRPPILESLTITAASASTFVDGGDRETVYPLRPGGGGISTTARPVRVNGPILAVLSAYDPSGDTGRAGVGSIEMKIDDVLRYRLAIRSFRFDQYPESGLVFDHRFSRLGSAVFGYRLFRLPGNDFGSRQDDPVPSASEVYPGAIDLLEGSHLMEIVVADAASNRSRARVCIQVGGSSTVESLEWDGGSRLPTGVRFRLGPVDTGAAAVSKARQPSDCTSSSQGVEAEFWDEAKRDFRPMSCHIDEGICLLPPASDRSRPFAVRLRGTANGVPGPWRILAGGTKDLPFPDSVPERVEAWPSFLDLLVPLETPLAPPLRLAAGLGRTPLENLSYRGGMVFGAAVGYARAAGLAPFFIVAENSPVPLASLILDVLWAEPGAPLNYQGPGFSLHLPEKARFFAGPLALRTEPIPGSERLPAIADAVDILPEGEALNDRATLSFDLAPGAVTPEALGIYRWDVHRKRWSYEGGDLEEGGSRLSLRFRRYGRFALLQDASPPELLEVRPSPGSRLTVRRPEITARVEDEGKGLNYDGVTFELDGRRLESEFDPDRGVSRVLNPPRLFPGTHHLKVVTVDLAGNASQPIAGDFEVR